MTQPLFMPSLAFNPDAAVTVRHVGHERQPVLIIDNALAQPQDMVEIARRVPFRPPARSMYPGVTAPLPPVYFRELMKAVRPHLASVFGMNDASELNLHGFLALATQPPESLHPMQRIPHQDAANPDRLGMVHYLCDGRHGGTGFFRHKATGFESVDAPRREVFAPVALEEVRVMRGGPARHVGPDTPGYEMTGHIEAAFNRLIVYRATVLHAGLLEGSRLSDDPLTGRLTANSFAGEGEPE